MLAAVVKIAFSGYLATSLISFAFPTLFHKKHRYSHLLFESSLNQGKIIRIAHRGGCREKVQNTVQAFQKSQPFTDMLQMDICETKDKVLVVHHDKTLNRICGLNAQISELDYKNLPKVQPEVQLHFTEQIAKIKSSGQSIPKLEDVFQKFPKMPMNIEIKTPSVSAVKELQRLVHKYNRLDLTFVGIAGKNPKMLGENFPQSHRFFSYGQLPKLLLLYFSGLLGFCTISQKVLQIPLYTKEYEAMKKRELGDNWKTKLLFLGIKAMNVVLIPLIWHLKRRGVMVYFWVCNTAGQYKQAVDLGCNGIMTDESKLLNDFLQKQKN